MQQELAAVGGWGDIVSVNELQGIEWMLNNGPGSGALEFCARTEAPKYAQREHAGPNSGLHIHAGITQIEKPQRGEAHAFRDAEGGGGIRLMGCALRVSEDDLLEHASRAD